MEDDYEIVPHKEIMELKNKIARLKGDNPTKSEDVPSGSLYHSVTKLNDSVNDLLKLFKAASESMEEEDSQETSTQNKELNEKLDTLLEQNKKIAEGIVALADLIKSIKIKAENSQPKQQSMQRQMNPQQQSFGQPNLNLNNNNNNYNNNQQSNAPQFKPMGPMPPPGPLKKR